MGTGSFGGGSGSLGGGGSGSGGWAQAKEGKGTGHARGSLENAVRGLLDLTKRLRRDPSQAVLTAEMYRALQDRGRRHYIRGLLAHDFPTYVVRDLLTIASRVLEGSSWHRIIAGYEVSEGAGTLQQLTDRLVDGAFAAHSYDVDERYVDCVSNAVKFLMLGAVGGDHKIFSLGDSKAVDKALDREQFKNTIGRYLGGLLISVISAESVHDLGAAKASVAAAAVAVASSMYDKFKARYLDPGKAKQEEILRVIGDDLSTFVGADDGKSPSR
jgi:hypothetical protein